MEVQVLNQQELWLYFSDANPIIKQWEEVEEDEELWVWKVGLKEKKIRRKINNIV